MTRAEDRIKVLEEKEKCHRQDKRHLPNCGIWAADCFLFH
jgi:hypothetical protein